MAHNVKTLQWFLRLNAAFSIVNAVLMIMLASPLSDLMGVAGKGIWCIAVGSCLLLFGAYVAVISLSSRLNRTAVLSIIWQDCTWVFASVVVLVFDPFNLSAAGKWLVALVALVVGLFAAGQWFYGVRLPGVRRD